MQVHCLLQWRTLRPVLAIFILLGVLLNGLIPVHAGASAWPCDSLSGVTEKAFDLPDCCKKLEQSEPAGKAPQVPVPDEECRSCFWCNVVSANVSVIVSTPALADVGSVDDVAVNVDTRLLCVSVMPAVPPPKALV
jgi:hypothetical protein